MSDLIYKEEVYRPGPRINFGHHPKLDGSSFSSESVLFVPFVCFVGYPFLPLRGAK